MSFVMPNFRLAGKILAGLLVVTLLLLAITTGIVLGSEKGRILILSSVVNQLNRSSELEITLEGLNSPTLAHWQVDNIVVKRRQQDWIDAGQLAIHWQPRALLNQSIVIDQIAANHLSLHHVFATEPSQQTDNKTEPNRLPAIPNIKIEQLIIDTLNIYDVPNSNQPEQPLRYAVNAQVNGLKGEIPNLSLQARGLDDNAAHLNLKLYHQSSTHVTLGGFLREPANGAVGSLLGLPEEQNIDANFETTISIEDNRYRLKLEHLSVPLLTHQIQAQGSLVLSSKNHRLITDNADLILSIDGTQHTLTGRTQGQQLHGALKLHQFPLDIVSLWHPVVSNGTLTTELTLGGTPAEPYAEGNIAVEAIYQRIPVAAHFVGRWAKDIINIDNLSAHLHTSAQPQTDLLMKGKIDLSSNQSVLDFTLKNLDTKTLKALKIPIPADFDATVESAAGNINGSLIDLSTQLQNLIDNAITGNTNNRTAENQINGTVEILTRGHYQQHVFSLRGTLKKTGNKLTALETTITAGLGVIQLQGELQKGRMAMTLNAKGIETKTLKSFNTPIPDGFNVNLTTLTADINGSLLNFPKQLNGEIKFKATGDYQQRIIALQGRINKNNDTLRFHDTTVSADDATIYLEGQLQQDTLETDVRVNTTALPVSLLSLIGQEIPEALEAQVNADLRLRGYALNPKVQGGITLSGHYDEVPISLVAQGQYQANNIQLKQLTLATNNETLLRASGTFQDGHFDVQTHAQKLPTQLLSTIGWHIQPGTFNAEIHALGTLNNPNISGNINYQTTFSGYNEDGEKEDVNFSWDMDITSEVSSLNLKSSVARNNSSPEELLVSVPLQPYIEYSSGTLQAHQQTVTPPKPHDLPLNATIKGRVNLQTVSFFINPDLHRLSGDAAVNLALSGTMEEPKVNGFLQFNNAHYENPVSGTLIDAIDCHITAEYNQFNIDQCHATDGAKGNYQLTGRVQTPTIPAINATTHNAPGLVELKLITQGANILRRPDIESEASGEVTLSGDFTSLLASGTLEVSPLNIILDSTLSHDIPTINIEEVNQPNQHTPKSLSNNTALPAINLNLTLTTEQQAFLRGRGLEAELKGKMHIKGDLKNPRYDGNVETVRGIFNLFNKNFELTEGNVSFNNNALSIAVSASYDKNDQLIIADLSGTQDDLTLKLSSTPEMAEDEILAYIIFGRSMQNISPFQAIQLAAAIQSLRGGANGSFDPIGSARNLLHIDTLSIESTTTDDDETGVNIGVGKYINERVYLEVERTPNPSQPWRGNLEIELTPNINLESSTGGNTGIEGAELKWKKDY